MESLLKPSRDAAKAAKEEVSAGEKVFHIADHVFLGSHYGAADGALLAALKVHAVVNLSAGTGRVPCYFGRSGVEYLHLELADELATDPSQAIPRGCEAVHQWGQEGKNVLVHCKAGLSRSTTVVMSWLIRHRGFSLKQAADLVSKSRGRPLRCAPPFWCYLAGLEREMNGWPAGTPPSFDFTPKVFEAFNHMRLSEEQISNALQRDADWVHFALFYAALRDWGFRQLVVVGFVAQRPDADPAVVERAISSTLLMMEVYHCWPALQAFGMESLATLAGNTPKNAQGIFAAGAMAKTLQAMQEHLGEVKVQLAACGLMCNLAAKVAPANFRKEFAILRGAAVVAGSLQHHSTEAELHELVKGLLAGLTDPAGQGRPGSMEPMRVVSSSVGTVKETASARSTEAAIGEDFHAHAAGG